MNLWMATALLGLLVAGGLTGNHASDSRSHEPAGPEGYGLEPLEIPLRDGATLKGTLHRGSDDARPVIMMRGAGPHFHGWTGWKKDRWHAMGYHCVGTDYRSSPSYINDVEDGYDVVEWAARQEWCNGQVVMGGKSKWGITAVRAAQANPPHLVAIVPQVHGLGLKPYDAYELGRLKPLSTWDEYLAMQLSDGQEDARVDEAAPGVAAEVVADEPWEYQVWSAERAREQFESIGIPMFTYGGWYDRYPDRQTLHYLAALEFSTSPNVRLVLDVTDHLGRVMGDRDFAGKVPYDLQGEVDKWLKPILAGDSEQTGPRVAMFAMGINEWRTYDEWPPADRRQTRFYFSAPGGSRHGSLLTRPPGDEEPSSYTYDPDDPCPTLGCSNSEYRQNPLVPIGPHDQSSLGDRGDVLVFRSEPLTEPLNVTGPLMVKLYAKTDVPCTQWVVQVCDEYPDGTAYNLIESNLNARPQVVDGVCEYNIDVKSTSNVFLPGHRVRVHLTSSLFPLWERNLNTGTRTAAPDAIRPANQTVYHSGDYASYILLPVMQ